MPFLSLLSDIHPTAKQFPQAYSRYHPAALFSWNLLTEMSAHCYAFDDSCIVPIFPLEWIFLESRESLSHSLTYA